MTFPYDLYPPYDPTWPPRRTPFGFEPVGPLPALPETTSFEGFDLPRPPPTAAVPPVADPPRTGRPFDASTPTWGIGSAVPLSSDGPTYAQTEELLTLLRELVAAVNRIGR